MVALVAFLVSLPNAARAQSAENVAVVVNDNSPDSQRIAEYYVRRRGIPATNIIRIRTSIEETISRPLYAGSIEAPVLVALSQRNLQDRVLYIVLTKGVPIRIEGDAGLQGSVASVDSELSLLYRRMAGIAATTPGRVSNPYFLDAAPIESAKRFTHRDYDIYLVTRLDGFTVDDVVGLIDRSMSPSKDGRIVLDQQDKLLNRTGEDWLEDAAKRVEAQGHGDRVLLERTVKGVRDVDSVLGYYSWGSNDPRNRERNFNLKFVPGAIAGMFVSSDARTFKEPPLDWTPTDDTNKTKWYAGTPQSLIGDLVRAGVSGVSGHVAEPYLQNTARPQILFPAYLAGFNLAEAYYLSIPSLSWQNLVIGDPLAAPFRERPLAQPEIDPGLDERAGLPRHFLMQRMAALRPQLPNAPEEAMLLVARAGALTMKGDRAGARTALEQATRMAPQSGYAHLQLALLLDQEGKHEESLQRYRRVVELQPRNGLALNNLAYALATRQNAPSEALPFAERALAVAPKNGAFMDTMAWIEYRLGRTAAAARRIALAVAASPDNPDVRLHAAIINAAAGARAVAEQELRAALKLRPSLESTDDVKQLRARLQQLAATPQ
jgi:uncharacterized protein (TIGR03790 family)